MKLVEQDWRLCCRYVILQTSVDYFFLKKACTKCIYYFYMFGEFSHGRLHKVHHPKNLWRQKFNEQCVYLKLMNFSIWLVLDEFIHEWEVKLHGLLYETSTSFINDFVPYLKCYTIYVEVHGPNLCMFQESFHTITLSSKAYTIVRNNP